MVTMTNRQRAAGKRWLTAIRWMQLITVISLSMFLVGAGDDAEARFNTLGHKKLICVCGCNQILLECNHIGCTYSDRMRNELTVAVAHGDSDDSILKAFVQKYGTIVLSAPATTGFNGIAWVMPFAVLVAGFIFAGMIIMSWKNKPLLETDPIGPKDKLEGFREQARRETEL